MPEIVGVRFKDAGKVYYFSPGNLKLEENQQVIVETSRGQELGTVTLSNYHITEEECLQPLKRVVRMATLGDLEQVKGNRALEAYAIEVCEEKVAQHELDMRLIRAEYTFDRSKVIIYFTADGRVDFRRLVRDLASVLRTRIELRQIGVRDEAKMLGGIGICGREFCCSSFLNQFEPVSIRMAKEQGLSLNPSKISGTCGRLMCCLQYEQEVYKELHKTTPRQGSTVTTPKGVGRIIDVALLTGQLRVSIPQGDGSNAIEEFHKDEVKAAPRPKA